MRALSEWMIFVLVAGWVSGCGGISSKPRKERLPAEDSALSGDFRVEVRLAGTDPVFPSAAGEEGRLQERGWVTGARELILSEVIPVQRQKPAFLVWGEKAFGSAIVSVQYEHRIQDQLNSKSGDKSRELASFDETTRRWFVPMLSLFEQDYDANPADQHHLGLDFLLADGRRVELTVLFRGAGPLPPVVLTQKAPVFPDNPASFSRVLATDGTPIWITEFSNPASRPVSIWVRAASTGPLLLSTTLVHSRFDRHQFEPPTGPFWDSYGAEAGVRVSKLHLIDDGQRVAEWDPAEWREILVPARKSFRLEWIAQADARVRRCSIPAPSQVTIEWLRERNSRLFDAAYVTERTVVTDEWRLLGVQLQGNWKPEILVTEPHLKRQGLRETLDLAQPLSQSGLPVRTQAGEVRPTQGWAACSGIY